MYCPKCGAKQEINAGTQTATSSGNGEAKATGIIADPKVVELKCPGCGAPMKPKFGEMVITCEYCGASVALQNEGWKNVSRHTMLPLKYTTKDQALTDIKDKLDKGLFHRHLEEESTLEEMNLKFVPYWVVPVSARTNYTAENVGAEVGKVAATAALIGLASGGFGGGRSGFGGGGFGTGMLEGTMIGGMMGGYGGSQSISSYTLNNNYNYPVVAVKALSQYQPKDYSFDLSRRVTFDTSKFPKGIEALNGDIGEEASRYEAKTNVDQLQSAEAHAKHHMIRSIKTECDVSEPELLHAPVWFAKFLHKKKTIVMIIDGTTGGVINSVGVD